MSIRAAVAALALAAALALPGAARAEDPSPCFDLNVMAERVAGSDLPWEQRRPDLWRVDMPSETRDVVRVVLSCGRNVVPMFAVLANASDLQASADLYLYLLRAASHFDHVKIGVDPDGDYLVRIDLRPSTFISGNIDDAAKQIRDVVDALTPTLLKHRAQ